MIDEKLCGTFWIVNVNGCKYITDVKPIRSGFGWCRRGKSDWLCVTQVDSVHAVSDFGSGTVKTSDYKNINFPDVPKGETLEIEICKSGRVYTYES